MFEGGCAFGFDVHQMIASRLRNARNAVAGRRRAGYYRIEIIYLRLSSSQLALRRIAARVRQGGHNVPRADGLRRFVRNWTNFNRSYRPLANAWHVWKTETQYYCFAKALHL